MESVESELRPEFFPNPNLTQEIPMKDIEIIRYSVELIDPSPYQVREHFDETALQELAASVKEHGIIQPLTARVSPANAARLELVAGERRLRAARLAGLETVPVIVHELSDQAAQEIVLIENLQREDLTVLEEAKGYQKALALTGPDGKPVYSQESLSAKIGKPAKHISDRLRLLLCPDELVKAVENGEVALSTAMVVGRIPDAKLRQQAAKLVLKPETQEVPLNYEQTLEMIREKFVVSLKKPGFDIEDAGLVPEVTDEAGGRMMGGSCVGCPYCQQPESAVRQASSGGKEGNLNLLCTLPPCFRKKQDAAWRVVRKLAEEQNVKIIEGDASRSLFMGADNRLRYDADYVALDEKPGYDDVGMKCYDNEKKWRGLLKGTDVQTVIARHPVTGQRVELAPRKEARVIAKAKLNNTSSEEELKNVEQAQDAQREARKKEARKAKLEQITVHEGCTDLAEAIGRKGMDADQLDYLFQTVLDMSGADGMRFMKDWLGIKLPKGTTSSGRDFEGEILKTVRERAQLPSQWLGFIAVAALARGLHYSGLSDEDLQEWWNRYNIRQADLRRRAQALLDAGKKTKKVESKEEGSAEQAQDLSENSKAAEPAPVDAELLSKCREWKRDNPGRAASAMADHFSIPVDQAFKICDMLVDEKHDVKAQEKRASEDSEFQAQVKQIAQGKAKLSDFIGSKPSPKSDPEGYKKWSAARMRLNRAVEKLTKAA